MTAPPDNAAEHARLTKATRVTSHLAEMLARADAAMKTLLDGTGSDSGWRNPWPGAPSVPEQLAEHAAVALQTTARRALQLHRLSDGAHVQRFLYACIRYAAALRVAAGGHWPGDLEAIEDDLRTALAATARDTRQTARGVLRLHQVTVANLREAGRTTTAGRIEHEGRHLLAELQRLAEA